MSIANHESLNGSDRDALYEQYRQSLPKWNSRHRSSVQMTDSRIVELHEPDNE